MIHVKADRKKCLVIIPAFNEEGAILSTVRDIERYAPSFDYVVINDNSWDETREILERNRLNHVDLPINSGIGAAVQTGYLYASRYGYTAAIQVDGDGQHDASFLEDLLHAMEEMKADMVIGSRFLSDEKEGFRSTGMRRVGIRFFTWLIRLLTGQKITDPTSGMRIVSKNVIDIFAYDYPKDYPEPETAVAILKRNLTVREIPVRMKARSAGTSSISPRRAIYYMIKVPLACILAAIRHYRAIPAEVA